MLDDVKSQDRRRKVSSVVSHGQGHKKREKNVVIVLVLKERKIKFECTIMYISSQGLDDRHLFL